MYTKSNSFITHTYIYKNIYIYKLHKHETKNNSTTTSYNNYNATTQRPKNQLYFFILNIKK